MSHQPQYQSQYRYTPAPRAANHWLDLLVKVGTLLTGATVAAVMGAHLIHAYSPPPSRTAAVAQVVAFYSKGIGRAGENSHWTMEASEDTAEWRKAVAYCAGQAPAGCATINTLSESGY